MRLSNVQQGVITQNEFFKLAMLTSNGLIEVNPPKTDDDRRDVEAHRKGRFSRALSIQIKSTLALFRRKHGKAVLNIYIGSITHKPKGSRSFYYFLAWFDVATMRFTDPVFLVPSIVLHRKGMLRKRGRRWHLHFSASMQLDSKDEWARYQIQQKDLGRILLRLLGSL
jgi:hypothetical protein